MTDFDTLILASSSRPKRRWGTPELPNGQPGDVEVRRRAPKRVARELRSAAYVGCAIREKTPGADDALRGGAPQHRNALRSERDGSTRPKFELSATEWITTRKRDDVVRRLDEDRFRATLEASPFHRPRRYAYAVR